MSHDKNYYEKRRQPRYEVEFMVNLKVGITLSGHGRTLNISRSGICIQNQGVFSTIKQKKIKELIGSVISIFFTFESFKAEGQIEWIDQERGEIGISILNVSDSIEWIKFCKNG